MDSECDPRARQTALDSTNIVGMTEDFIGNDSASAAPKVAVTLSNYEWEARHAGVDVTGGETKSSNGAGRRWFE